MEGKFSQRWVWYASGATIIIIIALALFWFFSLRQEGSDENVVGAGDGSFGVAEDVPQKTGGGNVPLPDLPGDDPSLGATPTFFQLSDIPVAGYIPLEIGGGVRYAEKERGHIYDVVGQSKEGTTKVSNTTIPRQYEAIFGNGGASVMMRYLDEDTGSQEVIKTYIGRIVRGEDGGPGSIDGAFLPDNVLEVAVSPNTNKAVYVTKTANGSSINTIDFIDRKPIQALASEFSEWIPALTENNMIILSTKASANVLGYGYRYNTKQNTFGRITRDKLGMTMLPNQDGSRALYSENIAGNPVFGVTGLNVVHEGEAVGEDLVLGIASLSDKCVWSRDRVHAYCASFSSLDRKTMIPDAWYQGVTSLEGAFWRIDTNTGEVALLADPRPSINRSFDAIKLALSPDEQTLYFIDKTNALLWGLRIPTKTHTEVESVVEYTEDEQRDVAGSSSQ